MRRIAAFGLAISTCASAVEAIAQERIAVLMESGTPVVATEFMLAVGPLDEDPAQAGIAHLAARSVLAQIRPALDSIGVAASVDAAKDALSFSIIAAPEVWETAARITLDGIFRDTPGAGTVTQERDAILDELRGRVANPADAATRELDLAYFGEDHPWGRPSVGTPETVARLTHADVADFLEEEFTPDRAVAAVVGPVDADEARDHLRSLLGNVLPAPIAQEPFESAELPVRVDYNSVTTWVSASYTFAETADEEGIRFIAFLAADALAPSPAQRSVYDVRSEVTPRAGGGEARIQIVVPPDESREWTDRLRETVAGFATVSMHDDVFENHVRRYRGERIMRLIAPEDRAREAARQLLIRGRFVGLTPALDGMTQDRMRRAATALDSPTMVILGPIVN